MNINYEEVLEKIYEEITPFLGRGNVASYIPELSKIAGDQFGMAICLNNGDE